MNTAAEKKYLRHLLRAQRAAVDPRQKRSWDRRIYGNVVNSPVFQNATSIMLFLSTAEEVDTWPILRTAWEQKKITAVPKVLDRRRGMIAVVISDLAELQPQTMGIMEPVHSEALDPRRIDLALVPGLAFDVDGGRLGYGAGYFDRFLPQTQAWLLGLIYSVFVRTLPRDEWDVPVNAVCTEEGFLIKEINRH